MKIDIEELTFQGQDGRDDFSREQIADKVITLITSGIDISPMIINGDWGTGKSEFCHKLINKFKSEHYNYKIVYIDAFQADHADNPLMTILSAVMGLIENSRQKSKLLKKSLPVARMVMQTVAKAAVAHTLKQNSDVIAEEFSKVINDSANSAIDNTIKAVLKDHEKAKENLKALKNTLSEISSNKPIAIFIDELDRCRPDFAIQMIETIKHTFDVENVFFVLITNTAQLKAAIKHRYGSDVNAQRYLDKFIKFSFTLPTFVPKHQLHVYDSIHASSQYFTDLISQRDLLKLTILAQKDAQPSLYTQELIKRNQLSLREAELLIRNLEVYQALTSKIPDNPTVIGKSMLIITAVYISCFELTVSESILNDKSDGTVIFKLISGKENFNPNTPIPQLQNYEKFGFLVSKDCKMNKLMYTPKVEWDGIRFDYFNQQVPDAMAEIKKVLLALKLAPHP